MFALILTSLLLAIGLFVARLLWPTKSAHKGAFHYGRNFAAVTAVLASMSSFETFYSVDYTEALARYAAFMTVFPLIGFALGCGFGLIKGQVKQTPGFRRPVAVKEPQSVGAVKETEVKESMDKKLLLDKDEVLLDKAYAAAYEELETKNVRKGLWARLLVESNGDTDKTRLSYTRARAEQIYKELSEASAVAEPGHLFPNDGQSENDLPVDGEKLSKLLQAVGVHKDFDSNVALIEFFGGHVTLMKDEFVDVVFLAKTYHFSSSRQFFHFCDTVVLKHAKGELSGS